MEKLKTIKRGTFAVAAVSGSLLVTSCAAESEPTVRRDAAIATELTSASFVMPGETATVQTLNSGSLFEDLKDRLPTVDHQYPHGRKDNMAPVITAEPMRVDAHLAMHGKGTDNLDNDAACDTFRIQDYQNIRRIGALSLGAPDDAPIIMWPRVEGQPSEYAYLCFFDGNEPAEGVVLFTDSSQQ